MTGTPDPPHTLAKLVGDIKGAEVGHRVTAFDWFAFYIQRATGRDLSKLFK